MRRREALFPNSLLSNSFSVIDSGGLVGAGWWWGDLLRAQSGVAEKKKVAIERPDPTSLDPLHINDDQLNINDRVHN